DLYYEDKRKARHDSLADLTPEDIERAMRVQRVVPVGDEGKYVDVDVLEGRATSSEAPRKDEAAKPLAPSFSSAVQIDPAKPEEFIYGGSILYGSGERESKRARKSQRLVDIERNELVLEVVNRVKEVDFGVGTFLELMCHDNKGRLSFRGPIDQAADTISQPAFSVYVRCVHGHHENLARTFGDEDIAVGWLSASTEAELIERDEAVREDRPIIPLDKAPCRLYHRTTRDAAFSILSDSLIPGYGRSGKAHAYFSGTPLEDAKVKSGVRASLPIEITFDTKEVLDAGCEVFLTESEGYLTASPVPGHCVLFINDDAKDLTLWARSGGVVDEGTGAGDENPARAEAEVPIVIEDEPASSSNRGVKSHLHFTIQPEHHAPPVPNEPQEAERPQQSDVPPLDILIVEPEAVSDEGPPPEDTTRGDETMPSVTERPTPPDGTLIKPTNVTTTTAYINNQKATLVVQD
ncbi:unnamed protein product, partial [Symbiodinium sp. CCMP2456]